MHPPLFTKTPFSLVKISPPIKQMSVFFSTLFKECQSISTRFMLCDFNFFDSVEYTLSFLSLTAKTVNCLCFAALSNIETSWLLKELMKTLLPVFILLAPICATFLFASLIDFKVESYFSFASSLSCFLDSPNKNCVVAL